MEAPVIRAYALTVVGHDCPPTILNARSAGAAKYDFWCDVRDPLPDLPFTAVRVRLHGSGEPVTSDSHRLVLEHRGRLDLVAGARVSVRGCLGTVIGAGGGGSWIRIQYDDQNAPLYVHPKEVEAA